MSRAAVLDLNTMQANVRPPRTKEDPHHHSSLQAMEVVEAVSLPAQLLIEVLWQLSGAMQNVG